MNRSFPSIAALLVSLSGAMLAVTWIPAESSRLAPHAASSRKRTAAAPCGYVTSGQRDLVAFQSPATEHRHSAPSGVADCSAPPLDLSAFLVPPAIPLDAAAVPSLPALQSAASAMAAQLAPLWPLRQQTTAPKDAAAEAQRQIEAEYAAAELAAAAPSAATPWITSAWDKGAASITDALQQASSNDTWSELYAASTESLSKNYDQWVTSGGWQETLPPLVAHVRRQHNRLVLREALLREMDRRFLEMPLDRDFPPLDPKPRYRGPSRRLMLAAADVLKSLSQSLTVAAEQLEAASRQDVAELHTPSENREEKR